MSFLAIEHASFAYRGAEAVVRDVHYALEQGEIHCLLGRSGCGKTTLLKMAAGLLMPSSGTTYLHGQEVRSPSPQAAFVFQSPTLLEWLSVEQNVLLPVSLKRSVGSADRERARQLLQLVGLADLYARYPHELSGGQQSRVAIARALVTEPLVLLMDEPFAALDAITREELQDDFLELCALRCTTVLFVTHDIHEAVYLADQVAVMDSGRIRRELRVDLDRPRRAELRYSAPFNAFCADARAAMDGGDVKTSATPSIELS